MIVTMAVEELLRTGPIIKIEIANPSIPSKTATVNALIDTGAAFTATNPRLAQHCQLIQRGEKKIHVLGNVGPTDAKGYPEFAASIRFPQSELAPFRVHGIVACPIFETKFSCLVGRDILKHWELTYNGPLGQFSIRDARTRSPEFA